IRSSSEMTMLASSTSWCWTVSIARSSALTTMSRPPSACSSSLASSSWKWLRVVSDTLADLAGDVSLRARVGRVGEDLVGVVELDDAAAPVLLDVELDGEEGRLVGHAGRLLHVVRDDHDRVVALEVHHQVLDLARGDRVERRAGLVHEDHVRLDGEAARDAEPLLLAARHAEGVGLEPVLDLVPERGVRERALHDLLHAALHPEHARPEGDVVVDRLGERVRLLEDHPDALAHLDRVDLLRVEVFAVVEHPALDPRGGDEVVHPVEAADQGGLAAAGGADQRGDLVLADVEGDAADGRLGPVGHLHVAELEDRLARLAPLLRSPFDGRY